MSEVGLSEEDRYLAIVNPAAGGGRSRKCWRRRWSGCEQAGLRLKWRRHRARAMLRELRAKLTGAASENFIAVGGDGTSYEVVNGLFPQASAERAPTLGFLPLGTGNSFLRDFSDRGVEHAIESLIASRTQACDVLRLRHRGGVIHYINLLSVGFPADVATLRARRFSGQGELGYVISIFLGLARLREAAISGARGRERRNLTGGAVCFLPSITASLPAGP